MSAHMGTAAQRRKRRFRPGFLGFRGGLRRIPYCARAYALECFDAWETGWGRTTRLRFALAFGHPVASASFLMIRVMKSIIPSLADMAHRDSATSLLDRRNRRSATLRNR